MQDFINQGCVGPYDPDILRLHIGKNKIESNIMLVLRSIKLKKTAEVHSLN